MATMSTDNQVQLKNALKGKKFEWQIDNPRLVCGVFPWEHHPVFDVKIDEELQKDGMTWFFAIFGQVHATAGEDDWGWDLTVHIMRDPYGESHKFWDFDLKSWEEIKQNLLFWREAKEHFYQLITIIFTDVLDQLSEKELVLGQETARAAFVKLYAKTFTNFS